MTFNIWEDGRCGVDNVARVLVQEQADVVGIQECRLSTLNQLVQIMQGNDIFIDFVVVVVVFASVDLLKLASFFRSSNPVKFSSCNLAGQIRCGVELSTIRRAKRRDKSQRWNGSY